MLIGEAPLQETMSYFIYLQRTDTLQSRIKIYVKRFLIKITEGTKTIYCSFNGPQDDRCATEILYIL